MSFNKADVLIMGVLVAVAGLGAAAYWQLFMAAAAPFGIVS